MFNRVSHVLSVNQDDHDDLQASLKNVLVLAQYFGLFPVIGVTDRDAQKLKFKWCSFRVCYAFCVVLPTFFMALMAMYRLFFNQSMLQKLSEFFLAAVFETLIKKIIYFRRNCVLHKLYSDKRCLYASSEILAKIYGVLEEI